MRRRHVDRTHIRTGRLVIRTQHRPALPVRQGVVATLAHDDQRPRHERSNEPGAGFAGSRNIEAGKRRLAGDTARAATSGEVKDLRREASALKEAVADLTLDLPRHRATRAGRRINLSHKEFCLLELLVRRQGEVLPRSLIASQVWDMNFDSDTNVIDVAIRRLRAKIDDDYEPKLIHTVRGLGYKLEVEDDHDES